MPLRRLSASALLAAALALSGCEESETGPVRVSAIGAPPELVNPNLRPLDAPSAFLLEAAAEGLVRFDAAGEIEPALAQSWIVSDDGLRYTFRIRRAQWHGGSRVTAEQVAARLRAAVSRASRSPLKPALGAMEEAVAMTDQVLEISLAGPRPNMLQMFAQPELAIAVNGQGTGPYRIAEVQAGVMRLVPVPADEDSDPPPLPDILLRGEPAVLAVARFAQGESDFVTGGTIGSLPFARAAGQGTDRLQFDPAEGLFGLVFASAEGALGDPAVRAAMSMALDREVLIASLAVPGLQPGLTLAPRSADEVPRPAVQDWAAQPMPMRRELAVRAVAALDEPLRVRVSMPDGPGYRLVFAHLRRDWRLIGIEAERVGAEAPAELRLVDAVAPGRLAGWYFRRFTCDSGPVCDTEADTAIEAARVAPTARERRTQLAIADRILAGLTPYIPIASPVRWSLVSPRLNGFKPNPFARHPAGTLIAEDS